MAMHKLAKALHASGLSLSVQRQHHKTLSSHIMSSSILASTNSAIGIIGFRITEMGGETWFDADVQDGENDLPATTLRLKIDVNIQEVYREADNIFRFMFNARVAIVYKGESTEPHHALAENQRGEPKSKLLHLTRLLDAVQQRGSLDIDDVKTLQKLLWISAFSRVGSIDFDQNHGPEQFIVSYLDEKVLEDMLLKMFSHLEEKWLREQGLQSLKNMPTDSKHPNEGPPDTDQMPSLAAFAVAVIGSELRLQLDV